jgi:KaiC/GvpD/RAD55 family RecA-like ATPase
MPDLADIKGLPLILGGNIRAVSKLAGHAESAVILIRGPAGSGKTIFATQLAAHEALVRDGDILYGCIELLPSELDAQLSGLRFGVERRELRVGNLPAATIAPSRPQIFASIIEVPDASTPDIGADLHRAMTEAREAGVAPKVIVIDSLAEGYRFGASVPRYLADGLAKFAAEQGIILVLLEEVADHHDSIWTFVADVVFGLAHHGAPGTSAAEQRAVAVQKNRFGPAHVGPHVFAILCDHGIEIYPRLSAYLTESAREFLPTGFVKESPRWMAELGEYMDPPAKKDEVVLVTGESASAVSTVVNRLTRSSSNLRLDMASAEPSSQKVLRCGDPLLGPEKLLSDVCTRLGELSGSISGLVIGDLQAINGNIDPDALRRAFPVLVNIGRAAGLPILLFETRSDHDALSIHLADTIVTLSVDSILGPEKITGRLSSRTRNELNSRINIPD